MLKELQSLEFWITIVIGGLLLGYAFVFQDTKVQLAGIGVYVIVLLGLVTAVLIRTVSLDVTMKEAQEISRKISGNPSVKEFYDETVEPLSKAFAVSDKIFLGLLEEKLEDFQILLKTELSMGTVSFPAEAWRVAYKDVLSQPDIQHYKSVCWIKSEDYWQDQTGKSSIQFNYELLKNGIEIERIFIVRDEFFGSKIIKNWIKEQKNKGIRTWVVKESVIQPEEDLLIDIGIYGKKAVGYQNTDEKSKTINFRLYFDESQVDKARGAFEKLKMHALTPDELESFLE